MVGRRVVVGGGKLATQAHARAVEGVRRGLTVPLMAGVWWAGCESLCKSVLGQLGGGGGGGSLLCFDGRDSESARRRRVCGVLKEVV